MLAGMSEKEEKGGRGRERGRRVLDDGMSEEEEKGGRGREREACAG